MEDNYNIQILIETRDFETLSSDERAIVLQAITEEEYRTRRVLVLNVKSFLQLSEAELKPDAAIKMLVKDRMLAQRKLQRTGWLRQIIDYRIPVYIPGLAFVLLLLILPWFYKYEKVKLLAEEGKEVPQIIYKTKTVTVEKEVPKYVNVPVIKYIERKGAVPVNAALSEVAVNSTEANTGSLPIVGQITFNPAQLEQQMSSIGKSNSEEEDLNKFLVVAR